MQPKETFFGIVRLHDAAKIIKRAIAKNKPFYHRLRMRELHRILQQRFPNLTLQNSVDLYRQTKRCGLLN